MKVLLTGAAGFIGSAFLWKLNALGIDRVWIVDTARDVSKEQNLSGKKFSSYLTREDLLQILDKGQLKEIDLIVHLGACVDTTEKDKTYLAKNNVEFSRRLATWALEHGKRFHYASSASVYGDGSKGYSDLDGQLDRFQPLNPYAESKFLFDRWLIENLLTDRVVGYRYFNVFGPNEYHKMDMKSVVCKAFDQIQQTGLAKLFATTRPGYPDGSEQRDFVYVKDVADVMAYFLEHPDKNGIFNVGTGKARSFKDLVTAVFSALGRPPKIEYIPMPEKLRGQYQYFTEADTRKLRQSGFQKPFLELEDSVADYVKNYLAKGQKYL